MDEAIAPTHIRAPGVFLRGVGPDVMAAAGLAVVALLFHWPLLVPGQWMPEGGGDAAGFLLPLFDYASRSLRSGEIPLWNPYLYAGSPLAADVQVGAFYPPNLALFLAVPRLTYGWLEAHAVAHGWWAGLGMYACARMLVADGVPVRRFAAFVGGVVFMLSDVFVTHLGNPNLVAAAAWLPWAFGPFFRATRAASWRRAARWAAAAACAVGFAGLAGHPQPFAMLLLLLALAAVALAAGAAGVGAPSGTRARGDPSALGAAARVLVIAGVIGALGVGLAAIALLPSWELAGLSRRAELDARSAAAYAVAPEQLSGVLVPSLFGRGMQRYWGPWPRVESGYLGMVALALAAMAVGLRARRYDAAIRGPVGLLALVAVIAFVLALGDGTPVYDFVRRAVPGMGGLRAPARFVLVADFALALLAALGLDAVLRLPRERMRGALLPSAIVGGAIALVAVTPGFLAAARLLGSMEADRAERVWQAAGGIALALGALAALSLGLLLRSRRGLRDRHLAGFVAVLAFAELAVAGTGLDRVDWDPTANHRPPAMAFLQADPGLYRVEVRPEAWGWWSPSAALLYDEFDVGGVYNPLIVADYQLFWESLTDRSTRLYDFLNAKYVVAPRDFALPWGKFVPVFDDDPNLAIFLNTAAMPRAVLVHDWRLARTRDEAWAAIRAADFDPAIEVVLEDPSANGRRIPWRRSPAPVPLPARPTAVEQPGVAEVTGYRRHEIDVTTTSASPAMLVLPEVWYPGWRATVGGEQVTILRANYAFRAVPVPPGRHEVRLSFAPPTVGLGAAITLVSVFGVIALASRRAV